MTSLVRKNPRRVAVIVASLFLWCIAPRAPAVTIGIAGDRFTFDGTPRFLLGVSYFDARNWHASDLDELNRLGYNSVRIWLDWADQGFFDPNGDWRARQTLLDFVGAANARGLAVDVTILNSDPHTKNSFGVAQRAKVVRQVFATLRESTNVFYDLMNEHNHRGTPASHDDLKELIALARQENPRAIITVSSTEQHIVDAQGTLRTENVDGELDAGVQVIAPHFHRTANWDALTGTRVRLLKDYLRTRGRDVPVYLNEEARRAYRNFFPPAEQMLRAARAARDAGAAGYNFHTGACFDLKSVPLFAQLDAVEQEVVAELPRMIFGRPGGSAARETLRRTP